MASYTNALGYRISAPPTELQATAYTTAERNALGSQTVGTMVYDKTIEEVVVWNGTAWVPVVEPATQIQDSTDPPKIIKFDMAAMTPGTTRFIIMPNRNVVLGETDPDFASVLLRDSVPFSGKYITLRAPVLPASYALTLPPALPATSGVLQGDNLGVLSWVQTPSFSSLTVLGPINGVRTYTTSFTLPGNTVGPVYPSMVLHFTGGMFRAKVSVVTSDWADDSRVASLETSVCGGKDTAGVAQLISVGITQTFGDAFAMFSDVVETTATTVKFIKNSNMAPGSGNYVIKFHAETVGGSLTKIVNGQTLSDVVVFGY